MLFRSSVPCSWVCYVQKNDDHTYSDSPAAYRSSVPWPWAYIQRQKNDEHIYTLARTSELEGRVRSTLISDIACELCVNDMNRSRFNFFLFFGTSMLAYSSSWFKQRWSSTIREKEERYLLHLHYSWHRQRFGCWLAGLRAAGISYTTAWQIRTTASEELTTMNWLGVWISEDHAWLIDMLVQLFFIKKIQARWR